MNGCCEVCRFNEILDRIENSEPSTPMMDWVECVWEMMLEDRIPFEAIQWGWLNRN
jgi:hypothetical protein